MPRCEVCRRGPGVLVLRVWPEEDGLRARILGDDGREVVAQGTEAICAEVRRWLDGC
ncbi:hypothetical protein KIH74_18390 [Kineosporia sp. J2-2]|uniref:Uncharacterized protein n=1 Tax=Kineosporia corallincola TaxID=2835133 RepID=A0ABS5TIL3_9ACTN|nr:hypothetical protein [Kineosporia corallincola]MBT0770915.1 hypothetical protein [Kineosporia corallincola]